MDAVLGERQVVPGLVMAVEHRQHHGAQGTGLDLQVAGGQQRVGEQRVAAGLTGPTPHDLRHTAASLAVSAGANVKAVQRLLGHASAAMTLDVYSGLFDDDLDALADRLEEHSARVLADQVRTAASVVDLHGGRSTR